EMQAGNATVEDPLDTNPKLSKPLCWLIEKMLAKDKNGRPADWAAVRVDISRVKKGRVPAGPALPEGASTISRSKRRTLQDHAHTSKIQQKTEKTSSPFLGFFVVLILAFIAAGVMWYVHANKPRQPVPEQTLPGKRVHPGSIDVKHPQTPSPEQTAMEMFEFAKKWASENKGNYTEIKVRFEKVAKETKGTKYSLMAEDEIKKLNREQENEIENILGRLKDEAKSFIDNKEYDKACNVFLAYSRRLAKETEEQRRQMAKGVRHRQKMAEEEQKQSDALVARKWTELTDRLISKLISDGVMAAYNEAVEATKLPELASKEKEIREFTSLLESAIAIDNKILDSFSGQVGQEITVSLNNGPMTLTVSGVSGGRVNGVQQLAARGAASRQVDFDVSSLTPGEKLKRMGQDSLPEVALVKGLMALSSKAYGHAKRYFGAVNTVLGEKLIAVTDESEKKLADEDAERALALLLRSLGYNVGPFDKDAWLKIVTEKAIPLPQQRKVADMIEKYRRDYSNTRFVKEAEAILGALSDSTPASPGTGVRPSPSDTEQNLDIPLPGELAAIKGDVNAVVNAFLKKNTKLTRDDVRIENNKQGQAVEVTVQSGVLEDIAAFAALPELKSLNCIYWSTLEQGMLKDVSALKYFRLESLRIRNFRVNDISAIKKMSSLKRLDVSNTNVKDISCLKGLPLESLNISYTKVLDFGPVADLQLKSLKVNGTQFKDFGSLKKMQLEELGVGGTGIQDISFLANMNIKSLDISGARTKDFSVLKKLELTELSVANTRFFDMTLLAGKKLEQLDISGTDVTSLSALKDMGEMEDLNFANTKIFDISPLAGLPIKKLSLQKTSVSDYSLLREMPIEELNIDKMDDPGKLLRNLNLPRLTQLNGLDLPDVGAGMAAYQILRIERHNRF
ncbi:MAG: hypothetical protein PHR77_07915, partial [Kiritimatiellae bacterium]|nr:hypothetical protein [Kiritimatiellia bacterium]